MHSFKKLWTPFLLGVESMSEQIKLFMGPQHPSMHGLWAMQLTLDGETVVDVEALIGYLHRGYEYLATKRTYHQFSVVTDRLCYVSSMSQTSGYIQAVEALMGITPPERAQVIRVLVNELQRLASHCLWLGAACSDLGQLTMLIYPINARELILDVLETLTGQRMTYAYPKIGGVAHDLPKNFTKKVLDLLKDFKRRKTEMEGMILESNIARLRLEDVGYLSRSQAIELGVAGPVLRGSGVNMDIRKLEPYWGYEQYDFNVPTRKEGDSLARYEVRFDEMEESMSIIKQAVEKLDQTRPEIMAPKVPRKGPKKTVYTRMEDSRGEMSWYLTGNGTEKAKRLKIRSPSFCNIQALVEMCKGEKLADVPVIMGSIDLCVGDLDR